MPYKNIKGNLPKHAQEIYRKSFNNTWEQYEDQGVLAGKKYLTKLLGRQ